MTALTDNISLAFFYARDLEQDYLVMRNALVKLFKTNQKKNKNMCDVTSQYVMNASQLLPHQILDQYL